MICIDKSGAEWLGLYMRRPKEHGWEIKQTTSQKEGISKSNLSDPSVCRPKPDGPRGSLAALPPTWTRLGRLIN